MTTSASALPSNPGARLPLSLSGMRQGDLIGGKYRIEGVIGEGGMGVVLYAIHLDLDRPVAIKLVRADLTERDEVIGRMLLEARAAANIRSEHVARVLDVGRLDSGAPYIVMEYLEGCDLCTLLEHHGRLAPDLASGFVIQACEALAEAHSLGIVHRDLKPENLFLTTSADGEPTIKVLDFGISKDVAQPRRSVTSPSNAVGSPHYMAPEQMRALDNVDARADIWALGAILFELTTGRPPFDADNLAQVCSLVVNDEPPHPRSINAGVPLGLEQAIWRCLRKDPAERFDSVADLARALAPFGSASSALSAERVSRISATTYRRSIMRLPMPSMPSSPLPRSLIPISVTPRGVNELTALAPYPRPAAPNTATTQPTTRPSSRKLLVAGIAIGASLVLSILAWDRAGYAPVEPHVAAPPAAEEPPRSAAPASPTSQLANEEAARARAADQPLPHKSLDELPPELAAEATPRVAQPTLPQVSPTLDGSTVQTAARTRRRAATSPMVRPSTTTMSTGAAATPATPPAAKPAQTSTAQPGLDAWDTTRFGGRR